MTFDKYQSKAHTTSGDIKIGNSLVLYPVLGLLGEAGELANKLKKVYRDSNGVMPEETRKAILLELSDILWYEAEICTQMNVSLDDVAAMNLAKLEKRLVEGKIHGNGDYR